MHHPATNRARLAPFLLPLLLASAGCHGHRHHHVEASVPVYRESEPNDDAFLANDFGVLLPGDRFYIDGWTSDLGGDPFDGFRFTAGAPVHVDFRLFQADPRDDFDVCLYDPLLDETLACFATADDPESGGVDVVAAGFDFHLVVESYVGEGAYSLEIEVYPLYLARQAGEAEGPALRARDASPTERDVQAVRGYGRPSAETTVRTLTRSVDPETGAVVEEVSVEPLDGPVED